jgi:hypothetical protein
MKDAPAQPLLFLELNEVNFEFLRAYVRKGRLPTFARLFEQHGFAQTESERRYEELEPWIQWVTAHTGKPLAEHSVFRLGDIVNHDIPQIWEYLEQRGLRVGAVSPMNAKNRLRAPAFFVPDPWTSTPVSGSPRLRKLYDAIAQAVGDNAQARLEPRSVIALLSGFLAYSRMANWAEYVRLALTSPKRSWRKATFLDLLLADLFIQQVKSTKPHFATLFLNAAAHIQHHYLFCSGVYEGSNRNPSWYVPPGEDPVLEVYELYDRIVGQVMGEFPEARFMIGTGLHQNAHPKVTYYWRLKDHAQFLREIGADFASVEPRMSRDFLVTCESQAQADQTSRRLREVVATDGQPLFTIDNRGRDLFVELTYASDIAPATGFRVGGQEFPDLRNRVAFVALKNGEHDGIGYFVDTGRRLDPAERFPLASLPSRICEALLGSPAPADAPFGRWETVAK